jgi:hypothetical protein
VLSAFGVYNHAHEQAMNEEDRKRMFEIASQLVTLFKRLVDNDFAYLNKVSSYDDAGLVLEFSFHPYHLPLKIQADIDLGSSEFASHKYPSPKYSEINMSFWELTEGGEEKLIDFDKVFDLASPELKTEFVFYLDILSIGYFEFYK